MSRLPSSAWLKPARNPPNHTRFSAAAFGGFRKVNILIRENPSYPRKSVVYSKEAA